MAVSVPDKRIVAAYQDACEAEADYAIKAVICGLLLMEKKREIANKSPWSHSETTVGWRNGKGGRFEGTEQAGDFDDWMEQMGVSRARGYRWMNAADRVARRQLGLPVGEDLPGTIDVEGTVVPLSQALIAPEAELSGAALEFRQATFDFMADKTLAQAVREACDGDSPASRITRAANGKDMGGTKGENRKDYPLFVMRKLRDAGGHIGHWETMDVTQRNEVLTIFTAAICGEFVSLHGRPSGKAKFEAWPDEVCEALAVVLRKRVKK